MLILLFGGRNNVVLAAERLKFIAKLVFFFVENVLIKCKVFETLESYSYKCGRMSVFQYYVN